MSRSRPLPPRPARKRPVSAVPSESATRPAKAKVTAESKPTNSRPGKSWHRQVNAKPAPKTKQNRSGGEISYRSISFLAILVVFVLFLSQPIKDVLVQEQHIRQIKAQIVEEQKRQQELKDLIAQWDDPDYVAAQARARLGYVRPGETQYLVIDPQAHAQQLADAKRLPTDLPPRPWFTVISDSLAAAGSVSSVTPEAPVKAPSGASTTE